MNKQQILKKLKKLNINTLSDFDQYREYYTDKFGRRCGESRYAIMCRLFSENIADKMINFAANIQCNVKLK